MPPTPPFTTWGLTSAIIRSHCNALARLHPLPLLTNGTNLYWLSAPMSSHAERWPYRRASGFHQLSPLCCCLPSPVCWWTGREGGGGGGTHLSPFSCKLLSQQTDVLWCKRQPGIKSNLEAEFSSNMGNYNSFAKTSQRENECSSVPVD